MISRTFIEMDKVNEVKSNKIRNQESSTQQIRTISQERNYVVSLFPFSDVLLFLSIWSRPRMKRAWIIFGLVISYFIPHQISYAFHLDKYPIIFNHRKIPISDMLTQRISTFHLCLIITSSHPHPPS